MMRDDELIDRDNMHFAFCVISFVTQIANSKRDASVEFVDLHRYCFYVVSSFVTHERIV